MIPAWVIVHTRVQGWRHSFSALPSSQNYHSYRRSVTLSCSWHSHTHPPIHDSLQVANSLEWVRRRARLGVGMCLRSFMGWQGKSNMGAACNHDLSVWNRTKALCLSENSHFIRLLLMLRLSVRWSASRPGRFPLREITLLLYSWSAPATRSEWVLDKEKSYTYWAWNGGLYILYPNDCWW
jgi:hypothetical protein